MKITLFFTLLSCLLGISTISNAQFFDKLSNPQITVNINHAPGLGLKIHKVAFNRAVGNCSDQIISTLIQDFVNNNVDVVDRANLKAILSEHKLNASGYIDQKSAVSIGKIIGPSALITVRVLRCETKRDKLSGTEKKRDYKTKKDYVVKYNISRTTAILKVSIQTVDLTTGRIFAAKMFDYAPLMENKSYEGVPESPSENQVQEIAFNFLATDVHRLFFTWTEPTLLYYFDDKDGGLKQAFQALKLGDIDGAYNLSLLNLQICKQAPDTKPKILAHAYYNLAMSYMIIGEYDKAINNLRESQKMRPGDIVSNTISQCIKAKNLMIEVQRVDSNAAIEAQQVQDNTESAVNAEEISTLINADIIALTQKKLSTSIILQKIKTSVCKFDTSTAALLALSKAGVHEDVIMLMMEKK